AVLEDLREVAGLLLAEVTGDPGVAADLLRHLRRGHHLGVQHERHERRGGLHLRLLRQLRGQLGPLLVALAGEVDVDLVARAVRVHAGRRVGDHRAVQHHRTEHVRLRPGVGVLLLLVAGHQRQVRPVVAAQRVVELGPHPSSALTAASIAALCLFWSCEARSLLCRTLRAAAICFLVSSSRLSSFSGCCAGARSAAEAGALPPPLPLLPSPPEEAFGLSPLDSSSFLSPESSSPESPWPSSSAAANCAGS